MKYRFSKKDIFIFALMGCTAILITVVGIYFHQSFFRILPLYIFFTFCSSVFFPDSTFNVYPPE